MTKILVLSPLARYELRSELQKRLPKSMEMPQILLNSELDSDSAEEVLKDVDIILGDYTAKQKIDRKILDKIRSLKFIQLPSSRLEGVDIQACKSLGIKIATCADAEDYAIAEHCIAVALILLRRLFFLHLNLLEGKWEGEYMLGISTELRGKTWGILGMQGSGLELAKIARSLGCRIIYTQPNRLDSSQEKKMHVQYRSLEQLLIESDIVSLHLSSNDFRLIGEEQLRLMKPTAILINTSVSGLIEESALAKALMAGMIMGASVDVFSEEPVGGQNPLILAAKEGAPLVLTPHVASKTIETKKRMIALSVANIARFILGVEPHNLVTGM